MNAVAKWFLLEFLVNSGLLLLQFTLTALFLYQFVVSMFGWVKRKSVPAERFPVTSKFALIVAAHNEEAVVGNIVRNLKLLNYPRDMYDIFVIADNCTDDTAQVARDNGAIVHERFDLTKKGKGYGLQWMFDRLFKLEKKYDAVCIFDADNLVSSNFLMEMNKQLSMGHKVIQGYLDSKNPTDSWIAGNYAIAYWIANRLFQLPRHYLGLNCALGGTGFAVSTEVLQKIGWHATCLTEDLEFSIKLVFEGMKVSWAHEAVIYDEKPLKLAQSWKQRTRWMQGHCDCAQRYSRDLFAKAFRDRDMVAFDSALYIIQPFLIVINAFISLLVLLRFILFAEFDAIFSFELKEVLSGLFIISLTYLNVIFILLEGKMSSKVFKYFLIAPIYSLTWIPIIIQGFISRNNREWVHTIHTRAMDIDALEELG